MIRAAPRVASFVDRKLPKPMQTFVTLYEAWLERLHTRRGAPPARSRRALLAVLLDMAVVAVIVIAFSLSFDTLVSWIRAQLGIGRSVARVIVVVAAGAAALPFCIGMLTSTGRLATQFASEVVPGAGADSADLGRAPRRLLAVTLQLAGVLLAGLPLVALTTPFLPGATAVLILGVALAVLGLAFWRRARDLHGHVRASAHVILEALATQTATEPGHVPAEPGTPFDLPGITDWQRIVVLPKSAAIGHSLAQLELRGTTGATVLAIQRGDEGLVVPSAHELLRAGDVLAVAGSSDAVAAARSLLEAHRS
jgi:CPA2 family monovalent cation:H+ antiporter-2